MVVKLIAADNPEWDRYVKSTVHDFFHTSAYHQITETFAGGKAWLAVCGSDDKFIAWPMIMQDLQGLDLANSEGWKDVTSVYG
jgi:hypothetical protein